EQHERSCGVGTVEPKRKKVIIGRSIRHRKVSVGIIMIYYTYFSSNITKRKPVGNSCTDGFSNKPPGIGIVEFPHREISPAVVTNIQHTAPAQKMRSSIKTQCGFIIYSRV